MTATTTPTPSGTSTPTVSTTATTTPTTAGQPLVVDFTRPGQSQRLDLEYPAGVIHWGYGRWFHSEPVGPLTTKNLTFKGDDGVMSATFTLLRPRRVLSLKAYNTASQAATLTLSCPGQPVRQVTLGASELVTIEPSWTGPCDGVKLASTNGWDVHFDDIVLEALPPSPPPPFPTTTIAFDDLSGRDRGLNGQYPAGLVDWGRDLWWLSGSEGALPTKHLNPNGPAGVTTATFTFLAPRRLLSLQAFNVGAPTVVTVSCPGQPTVQAALDRGQLQIVRTGWTAVCASVTISSGNGWDTGYDNLVIDAPAP
jgi:hypothetical protein